LASLWSAVPLFFPKIALGTKVSRSSASDAYFACGVFFTKDERGKWAAGPTHAGIFMRRKT